MVADVLHLVRHGEVHNPAGVVYGRLANFRLSDRGQAMARAAAHALEVDPVTRVIASPLLRTQQSAMPIAEHFGLPIESDDRVIEAANEFEGRVLSGGALLSDPASWPAFRNPLRPTWGEPYAEVLARMNAAVRDAFASTASGHVVIVSHQLPIWMVHRSITGRPLPHDPRRRRCALSSITTLTRRGGRFVETAYAEPAGGLLIPAVDRGAA